ncbi:TRAP transporter large permease subunit [Sphaerochaeta sp.]|uniref:TRAP transporter large permease subunit n=1 Tax=Sphaerochaeta sp. TaxID=1972642 RepID=UPI0026311405|nr:TRAP transporter large permease subunit [Sphaerochaeta sp.]MDX9825834.1 TRAP transporter large permease subunit [Sphaerochaeta sp.]
MATIMQLPNRGTQSVTPLAVPLFIFTESPMNSSGIITRLISHMRGGMAQVVVVVSTLMGGCSGSSNTEAAMEARILGPEMLKQNYPRGYTAVVIGFTSLIASLKEAIRNIGGFMFMTRMGGHHPRLPIPRLRGREPKAHPQGFV